MKVFPLQINLPDGAQADHVAGTSDPPRYVVNGSPVELNVIIPDDLLDAGWAWHGSVLQLGQMGGPCIMITTALHPPPGLDNDRRDCFTVARSMEAHRAGF